jgi:PQQ-dependent dehydrogenase (methanol/ethanol family)
MRRYLLLALLLTALVAIDVRGGLVFARGDQAPPTTPQSPEIPGSSAGRGAGGGGAGRGDGQDGPIVMDPTLAARIERALAPLARLTPVTPEMLQNPSPNDWLLWRRTYNGHGFSPLTQINRTNVKNLKVAWTMALASGGGFVNGFTPLVHDGVLFVWDYGDRVQAIDATTGTLLWKYSHTLPADLQYLGGIYRTKKHFGIHGNKLLFATSDLHLLALDVKTGKVIYDYVVGDYKTRLTYNAGPLVIKDKVLLGMTGTQALQTIGGAILSGHDVETGKELWQFHTVALPGEPGGNTWNDLPADKRWGGAMWTSGAYDPELNLTYWGTGQSYPWSAFDRGTVEPVGGPETTRELLYTSSTIALNPDTGQLVWYYSHLPNDHWDHDYAFERVIVTVPFAGRPRKVVMTMGKGAIMEALDAATGKFVFAKDNGAQSIVTAIDPETGEKTLAPFLQPRPLYCPSFSGARSWNAGSYSPLTKSYYFTVTEHCQFEVTPNGRRVIVMMPSTPNGELGRLDAVNLDTRQSLWRHRERAPQVSAVLATAGGIVFAGSYDRYLRAFDDQTGKILWQMRVNDVPNAFPMSYAVNGKQYIAMSIGSPSLYGSAFGRLTPELEAQRPSPNLVLWAFELP